MNDQAENKQSPLVSVVICTYNGEEFLKQALESVFSQSYREIEIIVVDDGSTDSTREILKQAQERDKRLKVFLQRNCGLANARNVAFNKAGGEWIALIDQDDLCYPNRIELQLKEALERSSDLVFSNVDYIDSFGKIMGNHLSNFPGLDDKIQRKIAGNLLLILGCFVASCSLFIRKNLIVRAGLLDESLTYVCDYEYFIKFGFLTDFFHLRQSLSAWRIHPNQATKINTKKTEELLRVYIRFLLHSQIAPSTRVFLIKRITRYSFSVAKGYLKKVFNWR